VPELYSNGATFGYNKQTGVYSIIGRNLFFELTLSASAIGGTTTNQLYVKMPILHKTTTGCAVFNPVCEYLTSTNMVVGKMDSRSGSIALFRQVSANSFVDINANALNATSGKIFISGQYPID